MVSLFHFQSQTPNIPELKIKAAFSSTVHSFCYRKSSLLQTRAELIILVLSFVHKVLLRVHLAPEQLWIRQQHNTSLLANGSQHVWELEKHKSPSVRVPGLFSRSVTKQITSGVTEQCTRKVCMGLEYVLEYVE